MILNIYVYSKGPFKQQFFSRKSKMGGSPKQQEKNVIWYDVSYESRFRYCLINSSVPSPSDKFFLFSGAGGMVFCQLISFRHWRYVCKCVCLPLVIAFGRAIPPFQISDRIHLTICICILDVFVFACTLYLYSHLYLYLLQHCKLILATLFLIYFFAVRLNF